MADILKRIIRADTAKAQLLVRFYTAQNLQGYLVNIDVPLNPDGSRLAGQALENYIWGFRPSLAFDREEKLAGSGAPELSALIEADVVPAPPPPPNPANIGREEAKRRVNQRADIQRGLFVDRGDAGQALVQLVTRDQAQAFKAGGYTGQAPVLIQAIIDGLGDAGVVVTPQQATDNFLARWAQDVLGLARVERVRVKWLRLINDAPIEADFFIMVADARVELEAVV